jgi:predicted transposase YbfD/YdcC
MPKNKVKPPAEYFKDITDPRIDRCKKHNLLDIIVITLLATISGAEGWEDIEEFAMAREEQLKKFLLLHHDRIETRRHAVTASVAWLTDRHPAWRTITSIGVIEAKRDLGGTVSIERRYYVSSLPADPELFAKAARSHRGIENSPHYVLDVAFREDACSIKNGNAPENMARMRKFAITLVRMDKKSKRSVKGRIKNLSWSAEYLERLLFTTNFADFDLPSALKPLPYQHVL